MARPCGPVDDVTPVKVLKKPRAIFQHDEMGPVIAEVPVPWRGPVATALNAGMREGEIFGARKEDVDPEAGVLLVSRSWDAPRTKDEKPAAIPIASALLPHLKQALNATPGELLFPRAEGKMQPQDLRLGKMLRRALARAGLVIGYEHRCRGWHCDWRERRASSVVPEACPKCGRATTWAKPIPRHVRFHDTRHSFGTQIVRGAGLAIAQKGLRHSDSRLMSDTYGHGPQILARRARTSQVPIRRLFVWMCAYGAAQG